MNKELDAFNRIMEIYGTTNSLEGTYDDFLAIKKALQRLETIDNANLDEALKTLEILDKTISPLLEPILAKYEDDLSDTITSNYFALKQNLIKAQENEKVVRLIFEKNVDILAIKESKTLEEYNRNAWEVEHYGKYKGYKLQLTQEEFDTLKEWTR